VPETSVAADDLTGAESLVDVLVASGLCVSRGDARRTLSGGGVSVNGRRQDPDAVALPPDALVDGRYVLIQKGRRNRHLLVLT
jgi:tyrosyl-tRNA synthetase